MDTDAARSVAATFVTDTTDPPSPRPRWLRRGRFDLVEVADVIVALICRDAEHERGEGAGKRAARAAQPHPADRMAR